MFSCTKSLIALSIMLPGFTGGAAKAALISGSLAGPNVTVTGFGPAGIYDTGYAQVIAGPNPLAMSYSGSSGLYVDYSGLWSLNANGSLVPGSPSLGLNQGGALTFLFQSGPVDGFGLLMNYAPGFGPVNLIALDAGLSPFQSYDIAALAPISGRAFQFRGIQDAGADIYGFALQAPGVPSPLVKSISYTMAEEVPEPSTVALMLAGLGLIGWAGARRQRPA